MAYFHSKTPVTKKGRVLWSVLGETREEMMSVTRRWPEHVLINLPPRGRDSYRSKSLPHLYVDYDRVMILEALESCEVPDEYMTLLRMRLRRAIYNEIVGECEQSRKFFEQEVRGKTIQLLRRGAWIDEPSSLSLKKLNQDIEKCDLGRRSDLNFSSNPISLNKVQKYDQDYRVTKDGDVVDLHPVEGPDFMKLYREGSKEIRQELWDNRPWQRSMFKDKYGEP